MGSEKKVRAADAVYWHKTQNPHVVLRNPLLSRVTFIYVLVFTRTYTYGFSCLCHNHHINESER